MTDRHLSLTNIACRHVGASQQFVPQDEGDNAGHDAAAFTRRLTTASWLAQHRLSRRSPLSLRLDRRCQTCCSRTGSPSSPAAQDPTASASPPRASWRSTAPALRCSTSSAPNPRQPRRSSAPATSASSPTSPTRPPATPRSRACSRITAASTCWSTTPASPSRARPRHHGADYDAVLDVSLRGTLYMSQAVIPAMQRQRGGSIVCISSVSAQRGGGILGGPHYSAAKAGVLGLARAMARELGVDQIRVNSITPGPDPDRHQQGQADRGAQGRDRRVDPARPPRRSRRRRRRVPLPRQRSVELLHRHHPRRERRHADSLTRVLRERNFADATSQTQQLRRQPPCNARPCFARPWR